MKPFRIRWGFRMTRVTAPVMASGVRAMLRFPIRQLLCLLLASGLVIALPLVAQETRSTIQGRVLDPQSSVVAGARVTVVNIERNTAVRTTTNETGRYEASLLLPGQYRISVEASGFKKLVREGIALAVGTRLQVDLQLELGEVTESITVTGETPLLETRPSSSGGLVDSRSLMDLPVTSNNALLLVKLTVGIQTTGISTYIPLHGVGSGSDYGAYGLVRRGNDWTIDGAPNNRGASVQSYMPYAATILEFKVETGAFEASMGHGMGPNVSVLTKPGTNEYHGTATWQHWQQRWNGTPFFVKQLYYRRIAEAESIGDKSLAEFLRAQPKQASGHSSNFAATLGGPVIIPGVFNGKNRLFSFLSYTGYREPKPASGGAINNTIPTLAARQGDFSQLLKANPVLYQIYDPLSVRPDPSRPGHYIRDAFPGNLIPRARMINPMYNAYVKFLPTPNNDPTDPGKEPVNNYIAAGMPYNWIYDSLQHRIDYHHSEDHRFFGRWSWHHLEEDSYDWTYESAPGLHSSDYFTRSASAVVGYTYVPAPRTILDFGLAANKYSDGNGFIEARRYKPSDVGLPKYMDAWAGDENILPVVAAAGYTQISRGGFPGVSLAYTLSGRATVSHMIGNHTIRGGFESRQHYFTGGGGGFTSGSFSFTNTYTRRNDDGFTPAGTIGHSWAAFMMGLPAAISAAKSPSYAKHSPYYHWYAQDELRLGRLTLNFGLRLEYEAGSTERYNRFVGAFDAAVKLPISDGAQAAYALNPLPELPADRFSVRGGTVFPGVQGISRRKWQGELMWNPRLAAAYSVDAKTVLRGGFGLFYAGDATALNESLDQNPFARPTSTLVTTDFGMNWLVGDPGNGISPLADPFPVRADGTRFLQPLGSALGPMASVAQAFTSMPYDTPHARQRRWRVSVQRQLASDAAVEVAYVGSYSDRIAISSTLSALPEQYWADGLVRRADIATYLTAQVPNPFYIKNFADLQGTDPLLYDHLCTSGQFQSKTIARAKLLRPFPHMGSLGVTLPLSELRTDALEVSFQKRMSRGFSVNAGYTRVRGRAADRFLNEFDPMPTWVESNSVRPHRLVLTGIYEWPFGKGRAFAQSGLRSRLLGGWQTALTYEWQPGPLLGFGNLFYYGDLDDINTGSRTLDRWFNTDGFERNAAKGPASYHRRVFPVFVPGLRADSTNLFNANLQRQVTLREQVKLLIRLDVLNVPNRPQFAGPSMSPYATNFGTVVSQTTTVNRFIQIQGQIRF